MNEQSAFRAIRTFRWDERPRLLWLELETRDGVVGTGEAFRDPGAVEAYLHEGAASTLALHGGGIHALREGLRGHLGEGSSSVEVRGNSAIELACWDLLGKRSGLPLCELMGGPALDRLPIYNTCAGDSYNRQQGRGQSTTSTAVGDTSPSDNRYDDFAAFLLRPAELAEDLLDQGIRAMKIWPFDQVAEKYGAESISLEGLRTGVEALQKIRDRVGDRMEILLEFHGRWSLPAAVRIANAVKEYRPYWLEDPIRGNDRLAMRQLRELTGVPVAGSERSAGVTAFVEMVHDVDYVICDLSWCGGAWEAMSIGEVARAAQRPIFLHDCTGPVVFAASAQLSFAMSNSVMQEAVRAFYLGWYRDVIRGVPEVVDGMLIRRREPGLGVSLRDEFKHRSGVVVRETIL